MRGDQQQGKFLLDNFLAEQFANLSLGNDQVDLSRKSGILKNLYMSWQKKPQTLFQFKEIYTHRLRTLRSAFSMEQSKTIEDLSGDLRACELVGLFKRIQEKRVRAFEPEYEEKYKNNQPIYSQKDIYELQDETSKVKLQIKQTTKLNGSGKFDALQTPYGVIIKCKGEYSPKINRFILSNVETPKPAKQQKMIPPTGQAKYMGVICEPQISDLLKLIILMRNSQYRKNLAFSQIVVIGGIDYNNIHQIRQFDQYIFQLGALVDVFIIPSSCEQTSFIYPLTSIPKSLLPKCQGEKKNIGNCTNPQLLSSKMQNVTLNTFISCGQNLLNLKANCNIQDDLQLMKLIIEYRHVCPSSVFNLPIESYNYDPLILDQTPHLMIHGKCETYQTEFWERECQMQTVNVRLVGLAKGDCATINLASSSLETNKWNF